MNPNRLQTFATVVRLGSFAAAAEVLSFMPSAVSQQMSKLEVEMGARLLRRGRGWAGRRVVPTEAGRRLYAHALTINLAVSKARDELAALGGATPLVLRVAAESAVLSGLVAPTLNRLRRRRLNVQCELFTHLDVTPMSHVVIVQGLRSPLGWETSRSAGSIHRLRVVTHAR